MKSLSKRKKFGALLLCVALLALALNAFTWRHSAPNEYSRSAFGGWTDADGDCLNTRHELLLERSITEVVLATSGCSVAAGDWLDPYTDLHFQDAQDVDIDHLVPLRWAWEHGASRWREEVRVAFANDPANLFIVDDATNQRKGSRGPLDWLPPSVAFRCEYVSDFIEVAERYALYMPLTTAQQMEILRHTLC